MNNMITNNQSDNFVKNTRAAEANGAADVLDLFAEELPEQHDSLQGDCVGTYGTALSCVGGSTFSSFSSASSL
jgi:hypothetical protein